MNHVFGAHQTNFSFLLVFYPFTSFACNFIMAHVGMLDGSLVVLFVLQLRLRMDDRHIRVYILMQLLCIKILVWLGTAPKGAEYVQQKQEMF